MKGETKRQNSKAIGNEKENSGSMNQRRKQKILHGKLVRD